MTFRACNQFCLSTLAQRTRQGPQHVKAGDVLVQRVVLLGLVELCKHIRLYDARRAATGAARKLFQQMARIAVVPDVLRSQERPQLAFGANSVKQLTS